MKKEENASFDITPSIDTSWVTGEHLRNCAGELKGLRHDGGTVTGAKGLSKLARFAFLMGATPQWKTQGRSFEELCACIDRHITEVIVPKCESSHPWLPDVTGQGWRPDLGVCQTARFTAWLEEVAILGAVNFLNWTWLTSVIESVTDPKEWRFDGSNETNADRCMRQIASMRLGQQMRALIMYRKREKRIQTIQHAWRAKAYSANGCMRLRDVAAFQADFQ